MNETKSATNRNWVRLNVGGKVFQTTKDTLLRYPESFLARLINSDLPCDKDESGALLIDRDYDHFGTILNYLRTGVLNFDRNENAMKELLCEADFYNVEPLVDEIREMNSDWVRLNVGGKTFQTTKDTLSRYPDSFMARLVNGELPSDTDKSGAILIDRSYEHFDTILNYLRNGSVNFDRNEKAMKDLLCEADFYNIKLLVDQINEAMSLPTNRVESIMLFVEYLNKRRDASIMVCSEDDDDYEVLRALRQTFSCVAKDGKYILTYQGRNMKAADQISFEVVLRSFDFVQESYDDNYDEGDGKKWKCWKFVRTVNK